MRIIFLAVDCQLDFLLPTGKLYVKGANEIIPKLKELADFASETGITVVNTMDYHTKASREISDAPDFKTTFPRHCMSPEESLEDVDEHYGPDGEFLGLGFDFIDEMYVTDLPTKMANLPRESYTVGYSKVDLEIPKDCKHIIIQKDSFDVFENINAQEVFYRLKPDLVVIVGVASDVCVNYAVLGLRKRGYDVVVAVDAIKAIDNSPENIYNLYTSWLMEGAWLASVDYIKKFVTERVK